MTITQLIDDQVTRRADLQALERYILTDQWAAGDGWTGPNPIDLSTGTTSSVLTLIEREFVSRNILNEVITRHRDGVLAREPVWSVSREKGRKTQAQEVEDAITAWWDSSGIPSVLQEAVRALLYARESSNTSEAPRPARSPIRLYIREKSVIDGRVPKRSTLAEALNDIGLHAAAPYAAGVLRNLDGDAIGTHYEYSDDDNNPIREITGVAADLRRYGAKIPDGTPDAATVVLLTHATGGQPIEEPAYYELGGRLLMHELTREPLITTSAIQQQKLINKSFTMMGHNMDIAGFTERTLLNAQMPGHWVDDGGATVSPEDGQRFVPDPLFVGAGATNWFSGLPTVDGSGVTRYETPSIVYRDPVPPEAFTATIEAARLAVYEEAKQLHVAISGDAAASGRSRVQAANDFVASLELTAREVERAVRWALETAVALASVLMGAAGRYDVVRVVAEARLAAVQPTAEDVQSEIAKFSAGLVSRESAMSGVGVEDVDAELAKIESEAGGSPADGSAA